MGLICRLSCLKFCSNFQIFASSMHLTQLKNKQVSFRAGELDKKTS
jgi:hypothetical protein